MRDRRRTQLDFKLEVKDSGDLLARYGMKNVIRKGKGKIEGQVGWLGSPITVDYPSMTGSLPSGRPSSASAKMGVPPIA